MVRKRAASPAMGDLFGPGPDLEPEGPSAPEASSPPSPAAPYPDSPDGASLAEDALAPAEPPAARAPRSTPLGGLSYGSPPRDFEQAGGVHLSGSILWCDADRKQDLSFISHSHADYIGKNRRILSTDKTVRILTRGTGKIEALTSPYRRSFALGPLQLELHPAGHVLGSAQLLIVRDGRSLVYTSDVNPRASATAERATPVPCDVLAIPTTYGLPLYRFPPRDEVIAAIRKFVDDALEDKATPVLIANQIGTSQELMHELGKAGHRLRVHRSIYDVAKVYTELGINLPNARRFQGSPARDEVVIFPPILRKHASIRKLKKFRTALVTGRAVEDDYVYRCKVDAAFALSDTADHQDLLDFIEATGAGELYLFGPHVEPLSDELRARGKKVHSLAPPRQLSLF